MNLRWTAAWMLGVATLLVACGGGADRTKAQVRLVNASTGYDRLELRVDDELRQGDVAYGGNAGYVEANPGKPATITTPSSPTSLLSFTPSTSAKKYYTVLAYGGAGNLKQLVLDDNGAEPNANRAYLRVINAAADAGAVDVYLTNSTDALEAAVPVQSSAAVDAVGSYIDVASGTWRVRVTGAGSKADIRQDVASVTLSSKQVATLVIVPADGGVLVKTLLLVQQAGVTPQAATQARVRVASGLTNTTARMNSTDVLPQANVLPTVGDYVSLAAGAQSLVVTIGGTPQASVVLTLAPGKDYTLLLHGTATAAATPALLEDDNHLPTDRTRARVRLVNGAAELTGDLSLTVDGRSVASNLAQGAASAYVTQSATTTGVYSVATADSVIQASGINQTFAAASTYTVFLLGRSGIYTGVLRQDR